MSVLQCRVPSFPKVSTSVSQDSQWKGSNGSVSEDGKISSAQISDAALSRLSLSVSSCVGIGEGESTLEVDSRDESFSPSEIFSATSQLERTSVVSEQFVSASSDLVASGDKSFETVQLGADVEIERSWKDGRLRDLDSLRFLRD